MFLRVEKEFSISNGDRMQRSIVENAGNVYGSLSSTKAEGNVVGSDARRFPFPSSSGDLSVSNPSGG